MQKFVSYRLFICVCLYVCVRVVCAQVVVRRPIAYSLHVIARVLGTQLTEEQLQGPFQGFLQDVEEVSMVVFVCVLFGFVCCLSPVFVL